MRISIYSFCALLVLLSLWGVAAAPPNFDDNGIVRVVSADRTGWSGGFHTLTDDPANMPTNQVLGNVTRVVYSSGTSTGNSMQINIASEDWSNYSILQFWVRANATQTNRWAWAIKNGSTAGSINIVQINTTWQRMSINISAIPRSAVTEFRIYPNRDGSNAPVTYFIKDIEVLNGASQSLKYLDGMIANVEHVVGNFNNSRTTFAFRSVDPSAGQNGFSDMVYNRGLYWLCYLFVNDPYNLYRGDSRLIRTCLMGTDYFSEVQDENGTYYLENTRLTASFPTGFFGEESMLEIMTDLPTYTNNSDYFIDLGNSTTGCSESQSSNNFATRCGIALFSGNVNTSNHSESGITYANVSKGAGAGNFVFIYMDLDGKKNNTLGYNLYYEDLNNDSYVDVPTVLNIRYKDTFTNNFSITVRDYVAGSTFYSLTSTKLRGTNTGQWLVYSAPINNTYFSGGTNREFSIRMEPDDTVTNFTIPMDYINISTSRRVNYVGNIRASLAARIENYNYTGYSCTAINQHIGFLNEYEWLYDLTGESTYRQNALDAIDNIVTTQVANGQFAEYNFNAVDELGVGNFCGYDSTYNWLSASLLAKSYLMNPTPNIARVLNDTFKLVPYAFTGAQYDFSTRADYASRIGGSGSLFDSYVPQTAYMLSGLGFSHVDRIVALSNQYSVTQPSNSAAAYGGLSNLVNSYKYHSVSSSVEYLPSELPNTRYFNNLTNASAFYLQTANYFTAGSANNALPSGTFGRLCLSSSDLCIIGTLSGKRATVPTGGVFWNSSEAVPIVYMDADNTPNSHARMTSISGSGTNYRMRKNFINVVDPGEIGSTCSIEISMHNPNSGNPSFTEGVEFSLNNVVLGTIYQTQVVNAANQYNWYTVSNDCSLIKSALVTNNSVNKTNNFTWRIAGGGDFNLYFQTDFSTRDLQLSAGSIDAGATWQYDSVSPFYLWGSSLTPKDGEFLVRLNTGALQDQEVVSTYSANNGQISYISNSYPYKVGMSGNLSVISLDASNITYATNMTFYDSFFVVESELNSLGIIHVTPIARSNVSFSSGSFDRNYLLEFSNASYVLVGGNWTLNPNYALNVGQIEGSQNLADLYSSYRTNATIAVGVMRTTYNSNFTLRDVVGSAVNHLPITLQAADNNTKTVQSNLSLPILAGVEFAVQSVLPDSPIIVNSTNSRSSLSYVYNSSTAKLTSNASIHPGSNIVYLDSTITNMSISIDNSRIVVRNTEHNFTTSAYDVNGVVCRYWLEYLGNIYSSNTSIACNSTNSFNIPTAGSFDLVLYAVDGAGVAGTSRTQFSVFSNSGEGGGGGGGGGGGSQSVVLPVAAIAPNATELPSPVEDDYLPSSTVIKWIAAVVGVILLFFGLIFLVSR
jgi:hypothetical protein